METKLIKRGTNWELYQNGSLIASTFDTDLPTITFCDEVAKELGVDSFPGEIAMLALSTSTKIIKYLNENGGEDIRLGELIVDLDKMFLELISKYRKVSDNADKRFTLEDMKKCFQAAREFNSLDGVVDIDVVLNFPNADNSDLSPVWTNPEEFIQSLTKEEYFCDELEMEEKRGKCPNCEGYGVTAETVCGYCNGKGTVFVDYQPKITNNSIKVVKIWKTN